MKTLLITLAFVVLSQFGLKAQCGINYSDHLKNCRGVYLMHNEVSPSDNQLHLALRKGNSYFLYILNANNGLPELFVDKAWKSKLNNFEIDKQDETIQYSFNVVESGNFTLKFNFEKMDNSCALAALYFDDSERLPGFYASFNDLKFNAPHHNFDYQLNEKTRKSGTADLTTYTIDISRSKAKDIGKTYGFFDGKDIYINAVAPKLKPGTEFNKIETIGNYYYYDKEILMTISTGTVTTLIPVYQEVVIDKNTGKETVLSKNWLKKQMENQPELLEEFLSEKNKNRKLKEYLIRLNNL